jgi:hypothetical protein
VHQFPGAPELEAFLHHEFKQVRFTPADATRMLQQGKISLPFHSHFASDVVQVIALGRFAVTSSDVQLLANKLEGINLSQVDLSEVWTLMGVVIQLFSRKIETTLLRRT